jgi:hypothetical protein
MGIIYVSRQDGILARHTYGLVAKALDSFDYIAVEIRAAIKDQVSGLMLISFRTNDTPWNNRRNMGAGQAPD